MDENKEVLAIVCGGREFQDGGYVHDVLDSCVQMFELTGIIQGGARGADYLAKIWATQKNFPVLNFKAEWEKFGKSAGYRRNVQMADMNPSVVIAFPGGKGTEHMINIARERRIPVFIV